MGKPKDGMPEGLSEELAQKKRDTRHKLHMERFHASQKTLAESKRHHENRLWQLRASYFQRVYGDVWREVMEGIRAEADGELEEE